MATTYPVLRWQIGDVRISRVVEIEGSSPGTFFFAEATPEKLLQHAWLKPHFMTDDGRLIASIHAFVIESQGRVIVVDTCVGNDKPRDIKQWNMRKGQFLEDMAEAGFPRERVDTVLCTHLHVDHVGWNTMLKDGKWIPTFPSARYLIGAPFSRPHRAQRLRPPNSGGRPRRPRRDGPQDHLRHHPRTHARPYAGACERADQLKRRGGGDYRGFDASSGAVRGAGVGEQF